jgi:hypothetical protein
MDWQGRGGEGRVEQGMGDAPPLPAQALAQLSNTTSWETRPRLSPLQQPWPLFPKNLFSWAGCHLERQLPHLW